MTELSKQQKRAVRRRRIRAKISGTAERPRLSVFKSNKYIYAQVVNDEAGETLASADSRDLGGKTQMEQAREVGKRIAREAQKEGVKKVVFDRGGYAYTGRVKELAEAVREAELDF